MSYARFFRPSNPREEAMARLGAQVGVDLPISDVYVLADTRGFLCCELCILSPARDAFLTTRVANLLAHLGEHTAAGHTVPDGTADLVRVHHPSGRTSGGEHGHFALCPDDCVLCAVVVREVEAAYQAALAEGGIRVAYVDLEKLTPQQRAERDRQEQAAVLAAEHLAAADPDPDYYRDLDDE